MTSPQWGRGQWREGAGEVAGADIIDPLDVLRSLHLTLRAVGSCCKVLLFPILKFSVEE